MRKLAILGLLAVAGASYAQVVNGGWEAGSTTGWTVVNAGGFSGVSNNTATWPPHSGTWAYHMGATSAGTQSDLYQDIATTVGQTYNVSFWLLDQDPVVATAGFSLTFGGQSVFNRVVGNTFNQYTQYQANIVATSTSSRLEFTGWESTQYLIIDDIAVTPVPEPASMAALGLGALALIRRRKAAKK